MIDGNMIESNGNIDPVHNLLTQLEEQDLFMIL